MENMSSNKMQKRVPVRIASRRSGNRKPWVFALAIAMSLMLPSQALAADWQASTWDDVDDAFSIDTDSTVNILALTDITSPGTPLFGNSGQVYTIDGGGNTLTDFFFANEGTVVVNNATVHTIMAGDEVTLVVNGDVQGISGDPSAVDYENPIEYSDGALAVGAAGSAVVTVNGNVTGGDGYGTYGYGGNGVNAYEYSTITINGNVTGGSVTGNPNTIALPSSVSIGGNAIGSMATATVTVNGNALGGNTNTDLGQAGNGILVACEWDSEETLGVITVTGTVTAGTSSSATGTEGFPIFYEYEGEEPNSPQPFGITPTPPIADAYWPTIVVHRLIPNGDGNFFNGSFYLTSENISDLGAATNYLVYGISGVGGSVTGSPETVLAGETVVLHPVTTAGYRLASVWYNGILITPINGIYSFTMPIGGADISAQFEPISSATQANYQTSPTLAKASDSFQFILLAVIFFASLVFLAVTLVGSKHVAKGKHVKK